jgi:hypothetical protein
LHVAQHSWIGPIPIPPRHLLQLAPAYFILAQVPSAAQPGVVITFLSASEIEAGEVSPTRTGRGDQFQNPPRLKPNLWLEIEGASSPCAARCDPIFPYK